MTIVLGWRGMYAQLLKDKRPRELAQLQEAGELDEVLALASKQAASTYRGIAGKNSTPMQQATAREIVIAQMVEEVEAIPKWSPEETAHRQALQAIPDICPVLEEHVCFTDCPYRISGRCEHPERGAVSFE